MRRRKSRTLSMNINEYIEAILPIAKLCLKEKANNPISYKSSHLWYLYRQAFYGFADFISLSRYMASSRAFAKYRKIDPSGNIRKRRWFEQPEFDKGRKKFHLEHIYTGDMFREAIELLPKNKRIVQGVRDIINREYCVAWILKEENKLLPKKKRGKSLQDAFKIYQQAGLRLIGRRNV